jgi:transposase
LVDALGNPLKLLFTAGNVNDCEVANELLGFVKLRGAVVMADKAYGAKAIREFITSCGATYAIPPSLSVKEPWACDFWQYKERHLVENFFQKLKNFRRVATRYDKLASRFASFVYLACIMLLVK